MGQIREVKVLRLMVKDTIEERILELATRKLELDDKLKNGQFDLKLNIEKQIFDFL